ncbi:MAG: hypothetical protein ACFE9Z_09190 [Promethearchaeota archaeon]
MEIEILKALLNISNRKYLFTKILTELETVNNLNFISYDIKKTSEGIIPLIKVAKNSEVDEIKHIKVFIGAQHNEYNGLFSIIKFFNLIKENQIKITQVVKSDQILFFFPVMNPYGFLNPSQDNKSGYYLKNGLNLNRFWRKGFVPEFKNKNNDLNELKSPDQVNIVRDILQKYWNNENIHLYFLDFHETSLLERFPIELSKNLNNFYKFDHWLKEGILLNIMKLYKIPYYRKPLFYKCNPSANHRHLNLNFKQLEVVIEKLHDYMLKNRAQEKMPFYFCYSKKSRDYCLNLANNVYDKLKEKLWETYFPAFDHSFIDHGCFVNMSDATSRPRVYSMELESQKLFFNINEEIEKSKLNHNYFEKKINMFNISVELALEAIKEMINLF